jgi:CTP synthase (UTP-ammonia lyase)
MTSPVHIGLIGDYDAGVPAHRAIPIALRLAADTLDLGVTVEWVPTLEITDASRVAAFDGLWCVPASPYQSMEGALRAILFARENGRPFLGTCGGFQHAAIEYARNVLGWADAEHAESSPGARCAVISPLACALVEVTGVVRFRDGTRIHAAYGCAEAHEEYHCQYALNPEFLTALLAGPLRESAHDAAGDVRAVELDEHPFFVATLFQPERAALAGRLPPLVRAFVQAVAMTSAVTGAAARG